ncbi:hypothetical protein [Phytohabitans rumicis]|uniref:hypothetical protein n=1 Tax=Phytohabitans rumicis TaxID=1076125 RepID=UPI0031F07799
MPSLSALAASMNMTSRTRIGEMLRGLALPADTEQARALLEAMGAVGDEVGRGVRLYDAAHAERGQQILGADRPGWWLRSGYVEQVGDIAPLRLLDRDDELAELATWCTGGDEAYVWWRGGPRAGKSALMAWFALHPPPDVWVVSFFVTARLSSQADSVAFTDGLLDQLSAITNTQLPPLPSPPARDRLRRQLLGEAAARAVKAGRRLVLLVDGLDEDCGSQPGLGLSSIAACLPKRPPPGLRVIVAGRPDPPIPADVDADHPLQSCRIRWLTVSSHATRVTELAQRELDEVLATDRVRHDGLSYQVLGLVTASGGGLDRRDLQQLTGRPAFEIDRLLGGVFGRTVAGRADPHTTGRVFMFTHETLRVQAVDRLGEGSLASFADRLQTWAAGYQQRGWPVETPGYLVRGYPRMLSDANDIDRLVALAADPARHDWMLNTTGGDAAALAEISTAHTIICMQRSPNLFDALRLAWYRDQLLHRNGHIPTQLPAVWAISGQPIRAEALARSITDPDSQAEALIGLIKALAAAGEPDRAVMLATSVEHAVRSVPDSRGWERSLSSVARMFAAAGDADRARQIARSLKYAQDQAPVLTALVSTYAAAGKIDWAVAVANEAQRLTRSIMDLSWQAWALSNLAEAFAGGGLTDHAVTVATTAEQIVRSIAEPHFQARAQSDLVKVLVTVGQTDHAVALATAAEHTAWSIVEPGKQAFALAHVASAYAAAGLTDHAEQLAQSITDPAWQAYALTGMATANAAAGEINRAEQIARSIAEPRQRAQALASLARAFAAAGQTDRAVTLATAAEHTARSITEPDTQALSLICLARALFIAGETGRAVTAATAAEHTARSITTPHVQAEALTGLAWTFAAAGQTDRAEQTARSITQPDAQASSLICLARALFTAGETGRAVTLAAAAEHAARSITEPEAQAQALADVIKVLVAMGETDRAVAVVAAAEHAARSITELHKQLWSLTALIQVLADAGQTDRALTLATAAEHAARSIPNPSLRARALSSLASAYAAASATDRAEQIAQSITETRERAGSLSCLAAAAGQSDRAVTLAAAARPSARARVLTDVIKALAAAGKTDRAVALATEAENAALSSGIHIQTKLLADLTEALVAAGQLDRAEQTARSSPHPFIRDQALADLVKALAAAGETDRAEDAARSITEPYQRAHALNDLIDVLVAANETDRVVAIASAAEKAAQSISEPFLHAPALTRLAERQPPRVRSLIANALAVGSWTMPLDVLVNVDLMALCAFMDHCEPHAPARAGHGR